MNLELFIQSDNTWNRLDITGLEAFPIVQNIADFKDLSKRNNTWSKTITLPGTATNNTIFKYIFDIQGIDNYDTTKRAKLTAVIDTIPILDGWLVLTKINCDNEDYWQYEVNLFSENANFSKKIDLNATLRDLDFNQTIKFDLSTATASWQFNNELPYYFGLYNVNTGEITSGVESSFKYLRPAIYVKSIWDKIMTNLGYTYESEFFNTQRFRSLVVPASQDIYNTQEFRFNSTFRAGLTQSISTISPNQGSNLNIPINQVFLPFNSLDDVNAPNGDPGGNFFNGGSGTNFVIYENNYEANSLKKLRFILKSGIRLNFFRNGVPSTNINGYVFRTIVLLRLYRGGSNANNFVKVYKVLDVATQEYIDNTFGFNSTANISALNTVFGTDSTIITSSDIGTILQNETVTDWFDPENASPGSNLNNFTALGPNETVHFRLSVITQITNTLGSGPDIGRVQVVIEPQASNDTGTFLFNNIDEILIPTQPFRISDALPSNWKQMDFISDITNQFNLHFYQDKIQANKIFIEPRDQFYTSEHLDWSRKLDVSKEIEITPVIKKAKSVLLKYKDDKDFYNTDYKGWTNKVYGQFEWRTGNELATNQDTISLNISPTPLSHPFIGEQEQNTNWIISRIFDTKAVTAETRGRFNHNPRILFRKMITPKGGQRFTLKSGIFGQFGIFNEYPYIGHLDDPFNPTFDLNFGKPDFIYFQSDNYPENNLFTDYYEQHFEELYGVESKLVVANFYLTANDLNEFDFRKLIYLDNISSGSTGYFRVNKIEWDPVFKASYKVELVKVLNNFKKSFITRKVPFRDRAIVGPAITNNLTTPTNIVRGNNSVVSGTGNQLQGKNNIIGGDSNQINSDNSIVSGKENLVQSDNSGAVGGQKNRVAPGANNSVIIGGVRKKLSTDNTVLIGGVLLENMDIISAGINEVLNPYSTKPVNIVSASFDRVRSLGSFDKVNFISAGVYLIDEIGNWSEDTPGNI